MKTKIWRATLCRCPLLLIFGWTTGLCAAERPKIASTSAPPAIVITAEDGATFESNKVVWRKNVRVSDREMELMCEHLTVYSQTNAGQRSIDTIVAETNVLIAQKDSWAFGDRAVYTASNDVVVLSATTGEVLLDNPDFYLIGTLVVFDRKTGKVHAPGAMTMGGSAQNVFGTNGFGISLPGPQRAATNLPPGAPRVAPSAPQRPPGTQ